MPSLDSTLPTYQPTSQLRSCGKQRNKVSHDLRFFFSQRILDEKVCLRFEEQQRLNFRIFGLNSEHTFLSWDRR